MSFLQGNFLIARSTLQDPNFAQTVILLLAHNDEGAYGVVLNRPFPVKGMPFPVFEGGPCQAPGLVLLHGHPEWLNGGAGVLDKSSEEVAAGIFVGDAACLKKASQPKGKKSLRVRVFRGFAGWGPGQLEGELATGAWVVKPARGQVLFDTPVDDLWDTLSPPAVPQFSLN